MELNVLSTQLGLIHQHVQYDLNVDCAGRVENSPSSLLTSSLFASLLAGSIVAWPIGVVRLPQGIVNTDSIPV